MDVLAPHRQQLAAPLDLLPRLAVGPVHDEARAVGVGQQDGLENVLARDGRDGVALGGADAPVGRVRGRGGGPGGVGLDLVALLVVGGDDGVESGEADFLGGEAAPEELDGLVN